MFEEKASRRIFVCKSEEINGGTKLQNEEIRFQVLKAANMKMAVLLAEATSTSETSVSS
jgi:hypothetical protein